MLHSHKKSEITEKKPSSHDSNDIHESFPTVFNRFCLVCRTSSIQSIPSTEGKNTFHHESSVMVWYHVEKKKSNPISAPFIHNPYLKTWMKGRKVHHNVSPLTVRQPLTSTPSRLELYTYVSEKNLCLPFRVKRIIII